MEKRKVQFRPLGQALEEANIPHQSLVMSRRSCVLGQTPALPGSIGSERADAFKGSAISAVCPDRHLGFVSY